MLFNHVLCQNTLWEYNSLDLEEKNIFGPVRSCPVLQNFWTAGPNVLLTLSHFTMTASLEGGFFSPKGGLDKTLKIYE